MSQVLLEKDVVEWGKQVNEAMLMVGARYVREQYAAWA